MTDRDRFDTLAPAFRVEIDGREVPPQLQADLVSVRVLDDVEATGMFAFVVSCWDGVEMKVKWLDDDLLREGNEVVIHMGYRDDLEEVFTGEISGLEPEFHTAQAPRLTVRGYDRSHRLMKERRTRSYLEMSDGDIASRIASAANLSARIEHDGAPSAYVLQNNQTDLAFLQHRAERIGYEVFVRDRTLWFRPRAVEGDDALTLRREVELLEFYPRSTTMNQAAEVIVRGWDPMRKQEWVGRAGADAVRGRLGDATGPAAVALTVEDARAVVVRSPVASQEEADALASARMNEMSLRHVMGDGVCIGRPDLRPGRVVRVDGIGERFGGLYYVTAVEHAYSQAHGYRTAFSVKRSATG